MGSYAWSTNDFVVVLTFIGAAGCAQQYYLFRALLVWAFRDFEFTAGRCAGCRLLAAALAALA
eukprot:5272025-Prymnesium_polylepis.1